MSDVKTAVRKMDGIRTLSEKLPEMSEELAEAIVKRFKDYLQLFVELGIYTYDDMIKILRKNVKVTYVLTDSTFTMIFVFPKHKVGRKRTILSYSTLIHDMDYPDINLGKKIIVSRLPSSFDFIYNLYNLLGV